MASRGSQIAGIVLLVIGVLLLRIVVRKSVPWWLHSWWLPKNSGLGSLVDLTLCALAGTAGVLIGALKFIGVLPYKR